MALQEIHFPSGARSYPVEVTAEYDKDSRHAFMLLAMDGYAGDEPTLRRFICIGNAQVVAGEIVDSQNEEVKGIPAMKRNGRYSSAPVIPDSLGLHVATEKEIEAEGNSALKGIWFEGPTLNMRNE